MWILRLLFFHFRFFFLFKFVWFILYFSCVSLSCLISAYFYKINIVFCHSCQIPSILAISILFSLFPIFVLFIEIRLRHTKSICICGLVLHEKRTTTAWITNNRWIILLSLNVIQNKNKKNTIDQRYVSSNERGKNTKNKKTENVIRNIRLANRINLSQRQMLFSH